MKDFAPFSLALIPLSAIVIHFGGPIGAAIVAVGGALLAVLTGLLLQGEEIQPTVVPGERDGARADRRTLAYLVLAGFILRLVLAFALRELQLDEVLGGDSATYHRNAVGFAAYLDGELPYAFTGRHAGSVQVGYIAFVGVIYWLVGPVQLAAVAVNCAIGALSAVPVYYVAARIGGRGAGRLAAVLVSFFPSLVLWSCFLVRDAPAFFLVACCAAVGQHLIQRVTPRRILLLLLCITLLATIREYIFLLVSGSLVAALVLSAMRRSRRALVTAVVFAAIVMLLVRSGAGSDLIASAGLDRIDEQRRLNALVGRSAITYSDFDLTTPTGALTYLPVGLVYFVLAPFPWQVGGRQALALPDMIVWYLCLPLVVTGVLYGLRYKRNASLVPLLCALTISLLYALVEGNVGIIVRHRAQVLVLLLPFAAVGFVRTRRFIARRRTLKPLPTVLRSPRPVAVP